MNEKKKLEKGLAKNLRYDLPSGLVVFLVAVPLCLGIALACGVDPLSGLVAGIAGGLVIPFISRSPLSVSGPAAGLIAIVLSGIESLGGVEVFFLAVFLAGIIQIILGLIRAGSIAYLFPSSVIRGMLSAIGVILILKQIPHALGYDVDYEGEMSFLQPDGANTFSEIWMALSHTSVVAIAISIISIVLLVIWDKVKFLKNLTVVPGALVVVLTGVLINQIFIWTGSGIGLEGKHLVELPVYNSTAEFVGAFTLPDWSAFTNPDVYVVALTLAVVGSLVSLLSVEAVDRLDPFKRKTPLNRELIAQGAGNAFSGFLGGLPVTAVIIRSSANVNSGGRTRTAAVVHGILLLLTVIFFSQLLNMIPLSALAGILLMIGYKLAHPKIFKQMWKMGWDQLIPYVTTIVAVVFTDMLIGITIGIAVGIFFVFKENFHSAIRVDEEDGIKFINIRKDLSFVNKAKLIQTLETINEGDHVRIDGKGAEFMDHDLREILDEFVEMAEEREIHVELKNFCHLIPGAEADSNKFPEEAKNLGKLAFSK